MEVERTTFAYHFSFQFCWFTHVYIYIFVYGNSFLFFTLLLHKHKHKHTHTYISAYVLDLLSLCKGWASPSIIQKKKKESSGAFSLFLSIPTLFSSAASFFFWLCEKVLRVQLCSAILNNSL